MAKISPYKVRLTSGVRAGGTITIPYNVGDAQADFDTTQGVNLLIVRRTGGRDERPFMFFDATDTFEVSFGASNIVVTWREGDLSMGDTDDVTFVFNIASAFTAQAADPLLSAIAAMVTAGDKLMYFTGSDTVSQADFTAFARTLVAAANAAAGRTALGLGTISTQDANNVNLTGGAANGVTVTGLPSPSASSDATTKSYVDNLASGAKWKSSVRVATTAAATLASDFENGDTIDGIVLANGDRILIKNQASNAENGIYIVAASGAPARASDADSWTELVAATVFVEQGTTNGDTSWNCTVNAGGTLGVTAVTWVAFGAAVPSASDTVPGVVELANNAETVTGSSSSLAVTPAGLHAAALIQGKRCVPIPATVFYSRTTNGAAAGSTEMTTNKNMIKSWDFDASTQEYIQCLVPAMPKNWNEGTITAIVHWTAASGSGDVIWGAQAVAISNDDTLDVAFGTAQEVTDTLTAANDKDRTSETSAITVGGSPTEGDSLMLQIYRKAADGGDTLAVDAKFLGLELFVTDNAGNDA